MDCVEAAAEILADGAEVQGAIGGAHVLSGEVGVEDFGDFVPRGLVRGGDVVEVVALDEEVGEDGVEVGVHGESPNSKWVNGKEPKGGRGKRGEAEGAEFRGEEKES